MFMSHPPYVSEWRPFSLVLISFQLAQIETHEIPFGQKKHFFYFAGGQKQDQVNQSGHGVFVIGYVQNLIGYCLG